MQLLNAITRNKKEKSLQTRLTYNCAHLRSTKESLTIWVKIFGVKIFLSENFLGEFFWGEDFLGEIFLGEHFWGENFMGENSFWVKFC